MQISKEYRKEKLARTRMRSMFPNVALHSTRN
jgi:hypothetical protein